MKKTMLAAGAAVLIGGMGVVGATSGFGNGERRAELASDLATRLNVDVAEVETALEAIHEESMAEKEAEHQAQLDEYIASGAITEDQAAELSALREEAQAQREEIKNGDLTKEEMKAAVQESREALQTWAEDNDLDLRDLFGKGEGEGEGHHGRGHHGRGQHGPQGDTGELEAEAEAELQSS